MALQHVSYDGETIDAETIARVQFFSTNKADGEFSTTWFDAIRCNELYDREIAEEAFYATEFAANYWICPKVRTIEIYNNPFLFDTGRNFVMVINKCSVAVDVDSTVGVESYSTATCLDDTEAAKHIDDIRMTYKIMAQNFNPEQYAEDGKMRPIIKRRFTTDLMLDFSQSMKFSVIENFIRLFDSWFVDFRDFTFFLSGYIDGNPKMNLRTYDYEFLGTSNFSQKYQAESIFGFFSVDWSQSEEQLMHIWVASTITGMLSSIGGYSTVLSSFFALLLSNYQGFVFDKSMLKKLYF